MFDQNPLPSGTPSPQLGAGPMPGTSGCMFWLPDGIPSPESGAGPGLVLATTIPQDTLASNTSKMAMTAIFFMSLPPYLMSQYTV
jgi:hypothetical protein